MESTPAWIINLKDDIVAGLQKVASKVQSTGQQPPPGTVSDFIVQTIIRHAPKKALDEPPPLKVADLTPVNIYAKPETEKTEEADEPTKDDDVGFPRKSKADFASALEDAIIHYVKNNKPIRVGDLADILKVDKPAFNLIIENSKVLKKAKSGWVSVVG